jgi:hypothetical protein
MRRLEGNAIGMEDNILMFCYTNQQFPANQSWGYEQAYNLQQATDNRPNLKSLLLCDLYFNNNSGTNPYQFRFLNSFQATVTNNKKSRKTLILRDLSKLFHHMSLVFSGEEGK